MFSRIYKIELKVAVQKPLEYVVKRVFRNLQNRIERWGRGPRTRTRGTGGLRIYKIELKDIERHNHYFSVVCVPTESTK